MHPTLVVEVTRQIRNALIEISRQAKSKEDRQCKQAKLYDYVRSKEFHSLIQDISDIHRKMFDLQNKEEKEHQKMWKERKSILDQLMKTGNEMESGIECIIQENIAKTEADTDEEQPTDEEFGDNA